MRFASALTALAASLPLPREMVKLRRTLADVTRSATASSATPAASATLDRIAVWMLGVKSATLPATTIDVEMVARAGARGGGESGISGSGGGVVGVAEVEVEAALESSADKCSASATAAALSNRAPTRQPASSSVRVEQRCRFSLAEGWGCVGDALS